MPKKPVFGANNDFFWIFYQISRPPAISAISNDAMLTRLHEQHIPIRLFFFIPSGHVYKRVAQIKVLREF